MKNYLPNTDPVNYSSMSHNKPFVGISQSKNASPSNDLKLTQLASTTTKDQIKIKDDRIKVGTAPSGLNRIDQKKIKQEWINFTMNKAGNQQNQLESNLPSDLKNKYMVD